MESISRHAKPHILNIFPVGKALLKCSFRKVTESGRSVKGIPVPKLNSRSGGYR